MSWALEHSVAEQRCLEHPLVAGKPGGGDTSGEQLGPGSTSSSWRACEPVPWHLLVFCSSHNATHAGHTSSRGNPHKWFHTRVRGVFIFLAVVLLEGGLHCPWCRSPCGAINLSRRDSQFLPSLAVCSDPRSEVSCSAADVQAWRTPAENWTFSGPENMQTVGVLQGNG